MDTNLIVAIVQARMRSTRLPGKVLLPVGDAPILSWVVDRTQMAALLDVVVVATTTDDSDDPIVDHCVSSGYKVFRGHPEDVLDRYYQAARAYGAGTIVRITADCPLIDPALIDETVQAFVQAQKPVDFAANRLPWKRTYPIGLDVEVCSQEALEIAWREATAAHEREHVMPYLYEHPERFQILQIDADRDFGGMRWTVDTAEDLELIREIAARMPDRTSFHWRDILQLLSDNPELLEINASVKHKTQYDVG